MSAISEIKDAIQKKIAGQGSQVDIGNGLPSVLNGMADLIQKSQELLSGGYLYLGFYDGIESPAELPEVSEDDKLFCLALIDSGDGGDRFYEIFITHNGHWVDVGLSLFVYRSGEDVENNSEAINGFVTPKGLVDYIAQNLIVDMTDMVGEDVDAALKAKLEKCLAIIEGTHIMPRITYCEPLLEEELDSPVQNCMFGYYRTEENSGESSIGGKVLTDAEVAYLQLGDTWGRLSY